jgi:hypothetical protein
MIGLYLKNLKGAKIFLAAIIFVAIYMPLSNAAILVYIGSNDGSPYHVPYLGIVDMPVWTDSIYNGTYASIAMVTANYAIAERLDGNFYYPWQHMFPDPYYYPEFTGQNMIFLAGSSLDSLTYLADFTFRMDIDTSFIGDTLSIMFANAVFSDSLGIFLFDYQMSVSEVVIDDVTSIEKEELIPKKTFISFAYPNPFNASVAIRYSLPTESDVNLAIYDIRGREVKTIYKEGDSPGENYVLWDGTDNSGDKVSSGVYLYRLTAGEYEATSRMTLLK